MKRTLLTLVVFIATFGLGIAPLAAADAPTPAAAKDLVSFRDVVKQVLPSVVYVESYAKPAKVARAAAGPAIEDLPPGMRDFFRRSPFGKWPESNDGKARLGSGSGFIVDSSGVIVTNYHVVRGSERVEVRLKDGRTFVSTDIKSDPKTDLAIVRIDTRSPLPALKWGDSKAAEIGDRVLAVGAPFGLEGTVTHGIVSGKGRILKLNMYEDFIQTDAAISPGNSGGPLVNLDGQVIGINSVIKTRTGGFDGVGLAISSDLARHVIDQLLKDGAVKRGYIGVQVRAIDADLQQELRLAKAEGALVTKVFDASPAAQSGIREGDVVTAWNDKPVKTPADLSSAAQIGPVGKSAELTVWRNGNEQKLSVNIERQPEQYGLDADDERPTPRR